MTLPHGGVLMSQWKPPQKWTLLAVGSNTTSSGWFHEDQRVACGGKWDVTRNMKSNNHKIKTAYHEVGSDTIPHLATSCIFYTISSQKTRLCASVSFRQLARSPLTSTSLNEVRKMNPPLATSPTIQPPPRSSSNNCH